MSLVMYIFIALMLIIFWVLITSTNKKEKEYKKTICLKCGNILSYKKESSIYNGGYNFYCEQAIGRKGIYCEKCGKIHFTQTDDEYEKKLPKWCKSHRQIRNGEKWNVSDGMN